MGVVVVFLGQPLNTCYCCLIESSGDAGLTVKHRTIMSTTASAVSNVEDVLQESIMLS